MITILKSHNFKRMPWKNGGGETIEIAVFPEGATLDAFDWRISMATVSSDGPFSEFVNIDRTLSVLSGDGIALKIGRMTYTLTPETPPLAFGGDIPTYGTLVSGSISDLNVMTRRGTCIHSVERFTGVNDLQFRHDQGDLMIIPMGNATLVSGDARFELEDRDCAWVREGSIPLSLEAPEPITVFLVRIDNVAD